MEFRLRIIFLSLLLIMMLAASVFAASSSCSSLVIPVPPEMLKAGHLAPPVVNQISGHMAHSPDAPKFLCS